jgi:hypothetical protein
MRQKNKYSPEENTANEYDHSHEWRIQGNSQEKDASQSEEDNSDKNTQVSEDQNNAAPAPIFNFKARTYLKGKH